MEAPKIKKKYPTEITIPFPGTADSWLKMVAKYGAVDSMKKGF